MHRITSALIETAMGYGIIGLFAYFMPERVEDNIWFFGVMALVIPAKAIKSAMSMPQIL